MFIDKARIFVTAGRGGDGCNSFLREKFRPFGGPDGGNGGDGGDVYLQVDNNMSTLLDLVHCPNYKAPCGSPGESTNKYGKSAKDLFIKVPQGTIVIKNGSVIADLKKIGEKLLIANGGRGGRGNASFKTGRNSAPRVYEKGEPGEVATIDFELKLIADVGLIGFPNAGKSTFLSVVSQAHPKIADYPFTTLAPNLGVAHYYGKSFVVADIPGIIEGAHGGKGLGDEFLRHIERTRVLVHLIDISGFDNKTAYENYKIINKELKKYSAHLAKKPMIVVVNKMDLTDSDKLFASFKKHLKNKKVFKISAVSKIGINPLMAELIKMLAKPITEESELVLESGRKKYIYEPEFKVEYEIIDDTNVFTVIGKKVEKLLAMTNMDNDDTLRRFQNILKKMGIERALKEKGIKIGDTVRIANTEFFFQ